MPSVIRQLLDEISWEGNATKYRNGGLGLENVLTAEVFQALDFLPRNQFLGQVLRTARGAATALEIAATHAEECVFDVLPGDLVHTELDFKAQPDVVISSPGSYILVEAKRIRPPSFAPEQLAIELLLAESQAAGRTSLLLVVLGKEPPISVRGHGSRSLANAAHLGAELMSARVGRHVTIPDPEPPSRT